MPGEQLSFFVKPRLVRHARDDRPSDARAIRFKIDEGFFLLAQHAATCVMCKREVETYDPDTGCIHPRGKQRDIRWCTEYRRMHAELFHLIGVSRG